MSEPRNSISKYYSPEVNETDLIPEAGLVQFMTNDHLSPPVVSDPEILSEPNLWINETRNRIVGLGNKIGIHPGDKVLDLGSGIGAPGRDIAQVFDCDVVGINITYNQLSTSRRLSEQKKSVYQIAVNADMQNLPIHSESIDAVFTVNALYHAPAYQKVIDEAFRTLKPGGRLGIDDWFLTSKSSSDIQEKLRNIWFSPLGFHIVEDVVSYAHSQGFNMVDREDYTEALGTFLTEENFGTIYDQKIASKIHAGFNQLYANTYPEYVPDHADQAVAEQRQTVLAMGSHYRSGGVVYQQLIFEKPL